MSTAAFIDSKFVIDTSTKEVYTGTADDLVGSIQTMRDCSPGDSKYTLVTGKTSDTTFWIPWGTPKDYREVLVCK